MKEVKRGRWIEEMDREKKSGRVRWIEREKESVMERESSNDTPMLHSSSGNSCMDHFVSVKCVGSHPVAVA